MGKRGLTRLSSTNSLSGIIPAGNVANSTLNNITAIPSVILTGMPELLSTQTASNSASIEFTSGIDSTYDIYKFEFVNMHPATNDVRFQVNFSTDSGSNYNVTKTTTQFQAFHKEDGTSTALQYTTTDDLAQSTSNQQLSGLQYNNDDSSSSGSMFLFQPSSTTFVKHFIARLNYMFRAGFSIDLHTAGYCNTTSAVDAVKFVMSSGNIETGTIKMYGISG